MIRKILLGVLALVAFIAMGIGCLYFWFLHAPAVAAPQLIGTLETAQLDSAGGQRRYLVYQPARVAARPAVVLVLHGSRGTAERVRQSTAFEFDELADRDGFLLVYPQGFQSHWNDCRGTADYAANVQDIDDVQFFRDLIAALERSHSIDRRRVFVTGHSNGGHMAYKLALEAPELVAAIAPISASLPDQEHFDCEQRKVAVPVAIFNGTQDPINPFDGGLVEVFGNTSRGVVLSSRQTAGYWAGLAGVTSGPETIRHPERDGRDGTWIGEERWTADDGLQVRLYTLHGSGHVVPSLSARYPRILGGNAGDLSGPAEIVEFFKAMAAR